MWRGVPPHCLPDSHKAVRAGRQETVQAAGTRPAAKKRPRIAAGPLCLLVLRLLFLRSYIIKEITFL